MKATPLKKPVKPRAVQGNARATVARLCLALPNAEQGAMGTHDKFVTGTGKTRKTFAYFLDNHHGDGIVAVTMKAPPGENTRLVARDSQRFYLPAYLGKDGWVAVRVDVPEVDWAEIEQLLAVSHAAVSQKRSRSSRSTSRGASRT